MVVHKTVDGRWKCSQCQKTFSQASTLKTHMRLHTREFPYECKKCKKKFMWKSSHSKHMKSKRCAGGGFRTRSTSGFKEQKQSLNVRVKAIVSAARRERSTIATSTTKEKRFSSRGITLSKSPLYYPTTLHLPLGIGLQSRRAVSVVWI